MAKKKSKKSSSKLLKNSPRKVLTVLIILLAIFILVKIVFPSFTGSTILGTKTYIAKGDDSSGSGSGSSGSESSGDSNSDDNDDDSSGSGSSGSGSGSDSSQASAEPTKIETRDSSTQIRTQTEMKQDETRTEVRLSEEERIRTRTKDGLTRIDITSGGVKVRLEQRDDRVIVKAEQEDGTEVELEDDTLLKIDERLGASGIKVATAGAETFVVQREGVGAITNFPLSIDLSTNTLTVNTSDGQRRVAVLPDQAIQNIIAANIVNRIGGLSVVEEVRNNNLNSVEQLITLGERNGVPVYEIQGISDQKLLGFVPVLIQKEVEVSAETGEIVATDLSLKDRIVDFFSI